MTALPEQLAQLRDVNTQANAIPYDAVQGAHEPADWWTDDPNADGSFVCRDYVLLKAERLRALGWDAASLTVVLCFTEPLGDPPVRAYHAVLAVEAGGETWILDNRAADIYRWDQPPYPYLWDRRQVAGSTEFKSIA
jgi:predicted transglutaminase-like cysteine proteinase